MISIRINMRECQRKVEADISIRQPLIVLRFSHRMTSEDVFGRIETKHSYSASSAFKLDGWHGMIITRQHHPMNWTKEVFMDLMDASMLWYGRPSEKTTQLLIIKGFL